MPDGIAAVRGLRRRHADDAAEHDRRRSTWASNTQLYTGERSASYDATLAALADAGAEPGDVVHAFGHSQGAMVHAPPGARGRLRHADARLARLARRGGCRRRDAERRAAPHRRSGRVLAGGGARARGRRARAASSPSASADPALGMHDYRLPAHDVVAYTETARLLDASADPRMDAVRELFDELGGAASSDRERRSTGRTHREPGRSARPSSAGAG